MWLNKINNGSKGGLAGFINKVNGGLGKISCLNTRVACGSAIFGEIDSA